MIRRPPRSPLFPSTTLSRSPPGSHQIALQSIAPDGTRQRSRESVTVVLDPAKTRPLVALRSEEHTSELQSRQYLVCRLLLEKKKKTEYPDYPTTCNISR